MAYQIITDQGELDARLEDIEVPESTSTYSPVRYQDLIGWADQALNERGFQSTLRSAEIVRNGGQLFATWTVTPSEGVDDIDSDFGRILGIRSSYDKSLPCGLVMGLQIMVCSNLMFSGDVSTIRRQTQEVHSDLPWDIRKMVERYLMSATQDVEWMNNLKGATPARTDVNDLVIDSMRQGVINSSHIKRVLDEWDAPTFDAFQPHRDDLFGLHNAFTHVMKKANPTSLIQRNSKLVGLFNEQWPTSTKVGQTS